MLSIRQEKLLFRIKNSFVFCRHVILLFMLFENSLCGMSSISNGTVTVEYGRISNMVNDRIHVASASTLDDCVRECIDFTSKYNQYVFEECFAYNYDVDNYTCELIHSAARMNYVVGFQTRWKTGFKY